MALDKRPVKDRRYATGPRVEKGKGIPKVLFDLLFLGETTPENVYTYLKEYHPEPPAGTQFPQAVVDFKKAYEEDPNSELTKKLAVYAGESIMIYEQQQSKIERLEKKLST
jgi:hypothetical protein